MSRLNYFCDMDVLNNLLAMENKEDFDDIDFTLDIIPLPYMLVYTSDAKTRTIKVMQRTEMHSYNENQGIQLAKTVLDKETKKGKVESKNQNLADNMPAFAQICLNLNQYIYDNHLNILFDGLDPEEGGILLKDDNGNLTYKLVRGKERPDLMCTRLFGGTGMGRPYMDEVMDGFAREGMSLEEKIEEAKAGDTGCMHDLAMAYLNGDDGLEPDPKQSYYWMHMLAEAGDSNGMFNTALFNAKGFGTPRSFKDAVYWAKAALDAGDEDARPMLEQYTRMMNNEKLAEEGNAEAQAELAADLMSIAGSLDQAGPGDDFYESIKWAEKAAAQGNGSAYFTLALAYEHGRGVKTDKAKAAELYQKGADVGNPRCMNSLGAFYLNGSNVKKDEKKGFELIRKAAEMGDAEAMANLGRCYQFATGTTGNMKKAVEWYEKSLKIRPDAELERKVAVFKMLGSKDPDWNEDYEGSDDSNESLDATDAIREGLKRSGKAYDDDAIGNLSVEEAYEAFANGMDEEDELMVDVPKTRFGRIKQLIDWVRSSSYNPADDALMSKFAPEIQETMQQRGNQFAYDEKTRTVTIKDIELTHTSSKDRVDRIERLHNGDKLKLRTEDDGTFTVVDNNGIEIGSLWAYSAGDVIRNDDCEDIQVIVTKVVPKSQRGKRAKKSLVEVTLQLKLKKIEREGVGSIICFVGGDQTRTWYQKIEVFFSKLPISVAEKLFEIYNRENNEYDLNNDDTGYIGLDNLTDEVISNREKIRSNMIEGLSYSKISDEDSYEEFSEIVAKAVEKEADRYGILKKYLGNSIRRNSYNSFRDLIEATMVDEEDYYWIDQTHVSVEEYEANADGFSHWYDVAILFNGSELPIDMNDEDVVSVFGTGKAVTLADLSYGC